MGIIDKIKRRAIATVDADERRYQKNEREIQRGQEIGRLEKERQNEKVDRSVKLHGDERVSVVDYAKSRIREAKTSTKIAFKKKLNEDAIGDRLTNRTVSTPKTKGPRMSRDERQEHKSLSSFRSAQARRLDREKAVFGRPMTKRERADYAKYSRERPTQRPINTMFGPDPQKSAVASKVRSVGRETRRDAKRYDINDTARASPFGGGSSLRGSSARRPSNEIRW